MKSSDSLLLIAALWMVWLRQRFLRARPSPPSPRDLDTGFRGGEAAFLPGNRRCIGRNRYVLQAGDLGYKLDNRDEAKSYTGKSVRQLAAWTGKAIPYRAQKIESSPASLILSVSDREAGEVLFRTSIRCWPVAM
jgi:hypothetical protein